MRESVAKRYEYVRRQATVVGARLNNLNQSARIESPQQPVRKLSREQPSEERADADARVKVPRAPNLPARLLVITELRVIQRQLHEPFEGEPSGGLPFAADKLFQRFHGLRFSTISGK